MPSFWKPKGVLSRSPQNWFYNKLAWGGAGFTAPTSPPPYDSAIISLFNDATDGSLLHVVAISASSDGNIDTDVDFQKGSFGSKVTQGQPARFDQGMPFGQIWRQVVSSLSGTAPGPIPNPFSTLAAFNGVFSIAGQTLWIVPPGYSLRFANSGPFSDIAIGLWWLVMSS